MRLITNAKTISQEDPWYIHKLRQPNEILDPHSIQVGAYYLYKEKHGIVAIVRVVKDISQDDWVGFRLQVKRVLYSPWVMGANTIFEAGFHSKAGPCSWHFEPCLSIAK